MKKRSESHSLSFLRRNETATVGLLHPKIAEASTFELCWSICSHMHTNEIRDSSDAVWPLVIQNMRLRAQTLASLNPDISKKNTDYAKNKVALFIGPDSKDSPEYRRSLFK